MNDYLFLFYCRYCAVLTRLDAFSTTYAIVRADDFCVFMDGQINLAENLLRAVVDTFPARLAKVRV